MIRSEYIRHLASQRGIALLLVLWVLTILTAIVFSFALLTRTETHSTISFIERMQQRYYAEAGMERAIAEIIYRRKNLRNEDAGIWKTDRTPYSDRVGDGRYSVRIIDESGKIDVNAASEILLKNLFLELGVKDGDADIIVDSIMDWKDKDELHRLHGAESDYYQSLPNPYNAKNADFDALDELLLVKGMTPEILYGTTDKKGAIDLLTVYTKNNRINLNAAPKEVLKAIPGMTPDVADRIADYRRDKAILATQDMQQVLGGVYNVIAPYIFAGDTGTLTIDATGYTGNGGTGYRIIATVFINVNNSAGYLYYKSPAL
jgi:general secretion pathway protein K